MNPIRFIKSVFEEGAKVEWLKPKELLKYSLIVLGYIIISTSVVALIDVNLINLRTFITANILL